MAIDFNKQKYMFLNGVKYMIEDIEAYSYDYIRMYIILILKENEEEKIIKYFNRNNLRNDVNKLNQLLVFRKEQRKNIELNIYSSKGVDGMKRRLDIQKRLENIGEYFSFKTEYIMDKNLTDLEFRFLCFLSLFAPLPKNEYTAELLNISTETLIRVIDDLKEKGYVKK